MIRHRFATTAAIGTALAVPLAACGSSSDNSKPAYCGDRAALQKSVSGIKDISLNASVVASLQTQLKAVEDASQQLVSSAKGEFPTETGAISNATKDLRGAVSSLQSSPSPAAVADVAGGVKGVVSSVQDFAQATENACS
jgi:hypothetical protein